MKSPDHPEREREYIMEVCTDTLKLWLPEHENILSFEWRLTHIRRAQFYSLVSKVEIEVGRYAEYYNISCTSLEKNYFEQFYDRIATCIILYLFMWRPSCYFCVCITVMSQWLPVKFMYVVQCLVKLLGKVTR